MRLFLSVVHALGMVLYVSSLQCHTITGRQRRRHVGESTVPRRMKSESGDDAIPQHPDVAQQFKIVTCSATSCAEKRKLLTMDPYATFSAFWGRSPDVRVEETSCLGACKKAPCVAIEHDEYEGRVALEGMNEFEFADRVFHRVITTADADRVWSLLDNAVRVMADEPDEEDAYNEASDTSGAYV